MRTHVIFIIKRIPVILPGRVWVRLCLINFSIGPHTPYIFRKALITMRANHSSKNTFADQPTRFIERDKLRFIAKRLGGPGIGSFHSVGGRVSLVVAASHIFNACCQLFPGGSIEISERSNAALWIVARTAVHTFLHLMHVKQTKRLQSTRLQLVAYCTCSARQLRRRHRGTLPREVTSICAIESGTIQTPTRRMRTLGNSQWQR